MAQNNSWLALIVKEATNTQLQAVASAKYANWHSLPIETITLPLPASTVVKPAIVSWRWDTSLPEANAPEELYPSRNILASLIYARHHDVTHLLIDVVSIDQSLDSSALMAQVLRFTRLYETLPVIAAYNKGEEDFIDSMRRPWITMEVKAWRWNRAAPVVHLSHSSSDPGTEKYSKSPAGASLAEWDFLYRDADHANGGRWPHSHQNGHWQSYEPVMINDGSQPKGIIRWTPSSAFSATHFRPRHWPRPIDIALPPSRTSTCTCSRAVSSDSGSSVPVRPGALFSNAAEFIWHTSYATTIMMILKGNIGIHDIYDLKYILPKYAATLGAAEHGKISRQDYLLTAAILGQIDERVISVNHPTLYTTKRDEALRPDASEFVLYSTRLQADHLDQDEDQKDSKEVYEVLVGDTIVAIWSVQDIQGVFQMALETMESAEKAIQCALEQGNTYAAGGSGLQVHRNLSLPKSQTARTHAEDSDSAQGAEATIMLYDVDLYQEECFPGGKVI